MAPGTSSTPPGIDLPLVPIDEIDGPLRDRTDLVSALGGDTAFYQFAANSPSTAEFYWGHFYRDLFFRGTLPVRLKELVRLRLAALNGCAFCSVGDRASAIAHGVTEIEVDAAFEYPRHRGILQDPREVAALDAATTMAAREAAAPHQLLGSLLSEFTAAEAVELLIVIGILLGVGIALVETGFVQRTCPVPSTTGVRRS